MNDRSRDTDRTVDEILDAFQEGGTAPRESAGSTEAEETVRRLDTEALGLLAYAAEPALPRSEVRSRILAAIAAEGETGSAESAPGAAAPLPVERGGESRERDGKRASRRAFWAGLVAAGFALAAFGLAAALWVELDRSKETLARLAQQQEVLETRLAERERAQQTLVRQSDRRARLMRVASTPGVEICPMRPVGESPLAPRAFAVLYMPPGEESSYLVVSELAPAEGGVYAVWLNTPDGPIRVAVIDAGDRADGRTTVEIPPDVMRQGRMLSAIVTLEESRETETPEGPTVLFGDEKMQLL